MPSFFDNSLDKIRKFWSGTNMSQRIFIAGLAATVVVSFFIMLYVMNQGDYEVLYSRMTPEDANKVVEILKQNKVPYKLQDGGATILVPSEQVYELRLNVAGEGGLVGQGVGFEIFDKVQVGQTDYIQKINYQRALQGELARTIQEFPEVAQARVHLVIPKKSLFIEEQLETTASIVLTLADGQSLKPGQVEAIVNLVALSVEGLDRNNITVADTGGNLLAAPNDEESLEGLTTTQLEYKQALQNNLERRIVEMLYPVIGPNKVIAKVNADLDFSQHTIHREQYDPDSAVVRSEQRSEESTQGRANVESGVPEANFRSDAVSGALSQQQTSRETRTTNFEIDKTEEQIVSSVGSVERLSVAVIVDGIWTQDPETKEWAYEDRSEEELAHLTQLVKSAVGFDETRYDQVEVRNISFGGPQMAEDISLLDTMLDYALRLGKPLLNAALIFLFLVLVVRPVILSLIKPRVESELVEGLEGLPEGEERLALIEADDEEADALDALKKIEDIKAHAQQLSEQNIEQAVGILRTWLKQQEGARVG